MKQTPSLLPQQQEIIQALSRQLSVVPVGSDGRPNRQSIRSAVTNAVGKLAATGMHKGKAIRLCGSVSAPRVVNQ